MALLVLAVGAVVPVVSFGAAFAAKASVDPVVQYLQDSGTVLTFTVHNTGTSDGIGAVEIARPSSSFSVVACPQAPAGWSTQAATDKCRYRSEASTADDIAPGASSSSFKLTSSAAGGKADFTGTWKVTVSKSNQFDDKSKLAAAGTEPPGLTVKVHSFEILDAVVATAPAAPGSACPAPNKQAVGNATHVIVICGKNRSSGTLTPTAAQSSLGGTFIAAPGTFSSGPITAKSASSRVLGNWTGAKVSGTKGTGKTVVAKVGASAKETSPLTTLTGYEVTNQAPTADAKTVTGVNEDGAKTITLSGEDADGDALQFSIVSGPSHGSLGTIGSLSCSLATPNHCTADLLYTPDADYNGPDSFTYKVGDAFNDSAVATVSITVDPVNDTPQASGTSVSVAEDGSKAIDLAALASDVETADANLTYTIVTPPAHGDYGAGSYGPDANFNGADSFTYKVTDRGDPDNCSSAPCDAAKSSTTETISITVDPVNDAPSASGTSASVAEDGSVAIDLGALVSDVETADANLTYTIVTPPAHGDYGAGSYGPDANFNGADSFTYKVTDRGDPDNCSSAPCDAAKSSTTETISITVDAVNDAPVNTVPAGPIDALQDTDTAIAGISIADADAAGDDIRVTLSTIFGGTIEVSTVVPFGVNNFQVLGNGGELVIVTAPLAAINATFAGANGVVYHSDPAFAGTDFLSVVTDDLGHNGAGGALSDADPIAVQVASPNAAPVAADKSATTAEDTPKTITLTATDADGDDPLTFAAADPGHGTVGAVGPVTCDHLTPNACSADVTYTPDANFAGADGFTYTAGDGTADSAPATVSITVTPVNDPPAIAGVAGTPLTYAEGDPATGIAGSATVTDIDSPDFETGTLTVDYSVGGTADDRIEIANQGMAPGQIGVLGSDVSYGGTTIGSFAGGSGTTPLVVTVDADATPMAVQALVRAITYRNVSENPSTAARTARFVVTDGDGGTSAPATRDIAVTAVHDVPVLAGIEPDALSYTENGASILITSTLTVTDADSSLTGATVTIGGFDAGDDLIFVNTASITGVYDTGTGVLSLSGTASPADYQAALRSIGYRSASEDPSGATRTITFQVKDGPSPSDLSNTASRDIAVTPVNDAPSVTTSAGSLAYTENEAPTVIDSGLGVADAEADPITGASASITVNHQAGQDSLSWSDNNPADQITLDAGSSSQQTVVLTGADSAANYQAALRAVKYANGSELPDTSTRTVTFSATDQPGATGTGMRTITVTSVDDPPVAVNDSATVLEDAAATPIPVVVNDTDVDGGPKTITAASDAATGTVVLTGGSPGAHTGLTYQPDPNYCNDPPGTAPDTFTYTLIGGSVATVSMTVTCVNDAPVADDETFSGNDSAHGNTTMVVNDPSDGAPTTSRPKTTVSGDILAGDTDVDGPGPLTVTPGVFATNDGGSVTIESDGDFTFDPAASTSCTDASDFFDYTVEDSGSPEQTDTGRVTIAIVGCVWYVSNAATGNSGTSSAPFDTLVQAETASGNGHTVFVFDGDDTSTGYDAGGYQMNAGERLIGEHEGLVVDPDGGGALTADTLHPANPGAHPTLTAAGADVIDLDDGNEVRGFNVDPQGGGGIAGIVGDTGGGTIDDVNIVDGGTVGSQAGLELNGTTGTFNVSNLVVSNSAIGVLLINAGTVNFASAGTISITSAGAAGLSATGTAMGTSVFDAITVTGSGSGGVSMTNTTGSTTFGDLSLTTTSGATPAFGLSNAGTVSLPAAGAANVSATGGPAVDVAGTGGATLAFDDVDSTNSANDGINLDGLGTGTFSADTSSTIAGAAGIAFDVNGGSGAVDFNGAIANGQGTTAEITGRTGGSVSLDGPITDTGDADAVQETAIGLSGNTGGATSVTNATKVLNTGEDHAVVMGTSDGHSLTLSGGGLDIDTTSGQGLDASASGILRVTGSANTIDTTTGTALNVSNTDIGSVASDDLEFRSITATDPTTSGIVLNNTVSPAGLIVTGNSSGLCGGDVNTATSPATQTAPATGDCTGGTISSAGSAGINLTSVPGGVSLTRMRVNSGADDGIRANNVGTTSAPGIDLIRTLVQSNGSAVGHRGLEFTNVRGTSSINTSTISGSAEDNARWENANGTLGLTVTNSTFADNSAVSGADGLLLLGNANATTMTALITGSLFLHNRDDGFQVAVGTPPASPTMNVTFTSNDVVQGVNNVPNNAALSMSPGDASHMRLLLDNNDFSGSLGSGVILNPGPNSTSAATTDVIVTNNRIGTAAAGSGSENGIGLWGRSAGNGTNRFEIRNNTIRHFQQQGMYLRGNEGSGQQTDYTVTGNTVTNPDGTGFRILLEAGSSAGDSTDVCFDVGGATAALRNTVASGGSPADIGVARDFAANALTLRDFAGGDLAAYFNSRNTGSPGLLTAILSNLAPAGSAAACALPATPPLP